MDNPPKSAESAQAIIKSKMMAVCVYTMTITLCLILLTYVGFSMYHNHELSENQLKLFAGLALGLEDIILIWFTAEIVQRKL